MKKPTLIILILALLPAGLAHGQISEKTRVWTPQIAGGYSAPLGIVDELFNGGFSIAGGVTYIPRRYQAIGAFIEGNYNGYDVNQTALDEIGVANGDLRMWSATAGMRVQTSGKVGFFFTLGAGWYRREIDLLNPTRTEVGLVCNPWWTFCRAVAIVPTQNVVGSRKENGIGYNSGLGITFRLLSGAEVYMEAKYHYVPNDVEPLEVIPFVIGYRWGS